MAFAFVSAVLPSFAQDEKEQTDSLVRLMQGSSLQLIEWAGTKYRKAVDATFLHNGTYLICDTALWNVNDKIINAWGNVKLIQDETVLTSESLDYKIDLNLAEFRGDVVQLQNKENNTLRAANLDYNTKDSTAVFRGGASMKDKDGQVIESDNGNYDSRSKVFVFDKRVNMFTDSVFVRTSHMIYDSNASTAFFTNYIDFWNEGNMLSAGSGWYNRGTETFFFEDGVHGLTDRQESWSDTLYVYRNIRDVEMRGNVQIQDTSRHVTGMADYIYYCDSTSTVTMKHQAAVALGTKEKGKVDTLYAGADTIVYRSVRRCDVPEGTVAAAQERLKNITFDAVAEFRKKAAEAAEKARAEAEAKAMEEDPNAGPKNKPEGNTEAGRKPESEHGEEEAKSEVDDIVPEGNDSLSVAKDSLSSTVDSLSAAVDTLPPLPDTTELGFVTAVGHVKVFRKDIQLRCDSLDYCDLDSIARFYMDPIVWNDGNRQYTSDSLYALIRGGRMDRASLMGNAFIITQEDSIRFDQIKSTEVVAYFDSTSALRRFDALGGANAMFYLKENGTLATVNKVESKMLSAVMNGGQLDRVYYYEAPKNDAYPVAQMADNEHRMKGFVWQSDKQPKGPEDITVFTLNETERESYENHPKAMFFETERFFPGYMESVYKAIEESRLRKNSRTHARDSDTFSLAADSLLVSSDSLNITKLDSLALEAADSLSKGLSATQLDSASVSSPADSVAAQPLSEKEMRAAVREEARKLAIARRDAKWAEKDARDVQRAALKEQKKLEKKRARTRRLLILKAERDAKDNAKREKYRQYYEKKLMKSHEQELESATERAQQIKPRGKVRTLDESIREPL